MQMPLLNKAYQGTAENPLNQLTALLKGDLQAVNALIMERMQSEIGLIPELAGHLIAAGGKRMRPLLTLAAAALFDDSNLLIHNVGLNPTRTAILDVFASMGANIRVTSLRSAHGEVVGDLAKRIDRSEPYFQLGVIKLADGSIAVPDALAPYMGGVKAIERGP